MSLVLCGDGHLDVLVLYEQHFPYLKEGRVELEICYDIIVRSHSRWPLSHICILSQYAAADHRGKKPVFGLFDFVEQSYFDKAFLKCRRAVPGEPYYDLSFPSASLDSDSSHFLVNRLRPTIQNPPWMLERGNERPAALLWATGLTLAEVRFADNQQILPYDPHNPAKTTYWLRLGMRPVCDETPTTVFGSLSNPLFTIRYCTIIGG